jgi:multidrug efflux system membrane fusion protein
MKVLRLRRWLPIVVFSLVCVSAAAWGLVLGRSLSAAGSPAHGNARGAAAPVTVAPVRTEDVPVDLDALGTLEASFTVKVVPQVTGLITELHFREGAFVRKGEQLGAQLDHANLT